MSPSLCSLFINSSPPSPVSPSRLIPSLGMGAAAAEVETQKCPCRRFRPVDDILCVVVTRCVVVCCGLVASVVCSGSGRVGSCRASGRHSLRFWHRLAQTRVLGFVGSCCASVPAMLGGALRWERPRLLALARLSSLDDGVQGRGQGQLGRGYL